MAATDKTYRRQHGLDIVFAISCLVMLASTIWMFVDDYNRPYKAEQRSFREVESAVAQRMAIDQLPSAEKFEDEQQKFKAALKKYEGDKDQLQSLKDKVEQDRPERENADAAYQAIDAQYGSIMSFYNIANERGDTEAAKAYKKQIEEDLGPKRVAAKEKQDEITQKIKDNKTRIDDIEKGLTKAQSDWKKVTEKFDTQVKIAYFKQWGWGDRIRVLPILDGFASPIKIQQFTNNDIPIDYNFKYVTRYDRCTTCHLGIDRPAYTKEFLGSLTQAPNDKQQKRLEEAQALLKQRIESYDKLPGGAPGASDTSRLPRPDQLAISQVDSTVLTKSRISEYAAHPRLDLYVGANSKHPMEKFGCSACHSGQGSATDFTLAAHTPNTIPQQKTWVKEHGWESQHMWDFPMLPHRFTESSCLKCHHEVTDLISTENRIEAPKLVRGYNTIKEFGCFGCHEIAGTKAGREIGPDLRLEPNPPLDDLTPIEQKKIESDPENRPGNMRKVGPSLYRVTEKTSREWAVKWLRSPRGFRPDTKMPHFYGLSNNDESVLPEGQKKFPNAEINAVVHYLFKASDDYLHSVKAQHDADAKAPQAGSQDEQLLQELVAKGKEKLSAEDRDRLDAIRQREKLRHAVVLKDLAPDHKGNPIEGRRLFTERGCLACHQHESTHQTQGAKGAKDYVPAVSSEAQFGPNLSQLVAKLGKTPGDEKSARVWLIQWISDPHVHSPRSRMPVTHLTPEQASDVAAWLLKQAPTDLGDEWNTLTVPAPDQKSLEDLARVYLVRILPKSDIEKLFKQGTLPDVVVSELPAEEKTFVKNFSADKMNGLEEYVGKKAVGRLGCFACHDVPGFDNAKSIGVGLNDWGKKDPGRLAFDDIDSFVEKHFYRVPTWAPDDKGKLPGLKVEEEHGEKVTKKPYEAFFYDNLFHRDHIGSIARVGFLNQKILDPRSYDYKKILAWDDRSRMPQFRFARAHKQAGEAQPDFEARAWKDEADARETVMTFILGLTGEHVPEKMTSQPQGDRLMEVKGRQVIDKFNCAGCHLIRPGSYDLRVTSEGTAKLHEALETANRSTKSSGFHSFPMDDHWTGKTPASPDRLLVPGVQAKLFKDPDDENAPPTVELVLANALRFIDTDKNNGAAVLADLPASATIYLPIQDLVRDYKAIKTQADLDRALAAEAPLGGTFANLLVPYLIKKDSDVYKDPRNIGDSSEARAALPPSLIGQGARTQPQWLYQFLRDPTAVRRMTILRMPKFNLSRSDADALVNYFAAVERISNPGIGLTYPGARIPQQGPLDDPFWVEKNRNYLRRLKNTKTPGGGTFFDQRVKAYQAAWEQAAKLERAGLQLKVDTVKEHKEKLDSELKAIKEKLDKASGKDKAALKVQLDNLEPTAKSTAEQLDGLEKSLKDLGPDLYKKAWSRDQAYAADAYRLVVNKDMCLQCHEVGGFRSSNPTTQGPPLALAHERLRPDWVKRWVATPQRFLTYASLMPVNFPKDEVPKNQDAFVGGDVDRIEAARNLLMNYPRIVNLPVNHQWNPYLQAGEKK